MKRFLRQHSTTLFVTLLGLVIFATLNYIMTLWNTELWTNPRVGFWSVFRKHFVLSGFDPQTYVMVSKWRPLYEIYRHPMLSVMVWPLSWINSVCKDIWGINCAIYVVAVTWTVISTATWTLLYRLLHRMVNVWQAVLLCLMYFGFSHVMLASFTPDHMVLTQFILVLAISLATEQYGGTAWWKALLLYFFSMGVTTTNAVKTWAVDMVACYDRNVMVGQNLWRMFRRSLLYIVPTMLVGAVYLVELNTTEKAEHQYQVMMRNKSVAKDSTLIEKMRRDSIRHVAERNKQLSGSKYLAWTDNTIDRLPLMYESIFGEGMILHEEHLLEDPNVTKNPRPVFVSYSHWWDYAVEAVIVALFFVALFVGRGMRVLWLALPPMLFDAVLHVGLRFAASDVYIMTAHWAFVIPIAIACLLHNIKGKAPRILICSALLCVTAFLWCHNGSLIAGYLLR